MPLRLSPAAAINPTHANTSNAPMQTAADIIVIRLRVARRTSSAASCNWSWIRLRSSHCRVLRSSSGLVAGTVRPPFTTGLASPVSKDMVTDPHGLTGRKQAAENISSGHRHPERRNWMLAYVTAGLLDDTPPIVIQLITFDAQRSGCSTGAVNCFMCAGHHIVERGMRGIRSRINCVMRRSSRFLGTTFQRMLKWAAIGGH